MAAESLHASNWEAERPLYSVLFITFPRISFGEFLDSMAQHGTDFGVGVGQPTGLFVGRASFRFFPPLAHVAFT